MILKRIALIISVFRRLVWITGLTGALICLVSASLLSQVTFGNTDFTFAFIILSFSVLLMQLTSGQNALMQGMRKYRYLAKANVVGNAVGLIFIIPLYYFWKIDAIVPVLLFSNALIFILSYIYARKIKIEKEEITITDIKVEGQRYVEDGSVDQSSGYVGNISFLFHSYFHKSYGFY